MELENKTIIIAGASSGIGAAAARVFASEGANVVLGARRFTELERLAESINGRNRKAVLLAGDVKDEGYADALVDLAITEFGVLDGAFNNAGIVGEMCLAVCRIVATSSCLPEGAEGKPEDTRRWAH